MTFSNQNGKKRLAEIIPILPEFDHPVGTFDIDQIPYIIEAGVQAARRQVPYLRRLLSDQ